MSPSDFSIICYSENQKGGEVILQVVDILALQAHLLEK